MARIADQFTVRFWGVRGSIACPGSETVRYGGNTPCVEMLIGEERLIFDGGTGLRVLGQTLLAEMPVEAYMFFTHSHWDHIQGFPFFSPAFIKGNRFHIYGSIAPNKDTIRQRLEAQMHHPNFPVPLQIMGADLEFNNIDIGQSIPIKDILVETALLNHPGEAVGYRVNWRGYSAAYITDTEHLEGEQLDENVLKLANEADVLIYDSTYTDDEYYSKQSSKVGWGHSTWQHGVKVAEAAGVKKLVIFHHDPLHNDDFLDQIQENAAQVFPNSILAWEGLALNLIPPCVPGADQSIQEIEVSA